MPGRDIRIIVKFNNRTNRGDWNLSIDTDSQKQVTTKGVKGLNVWDSLTLVVSCHIRELVLRIYITFSKDLYSQYYSSGSPINRMEHKLKHTLKKCNVSKKKNKISLTINLHIAFSVCSGTMWKRKDKWKTFLKFLYTVINTTNFSNSIFFALKYWLKES